jgi:hypothetical protein
VDVAIAKITVGSLVLAALFVTACSTSGAGLNPAIDAGTDAGLPIFVAPAGDVTCPVDAGTPPPICLLPDGIYPPCAPDISGGACASDADASDSDAGQRCLSCYGEAYWVVCLCGGFDGGAGVWNCQACSTPHNEPPSGGQPS